MARNNTQVRFFFGLGSRYSYLAATQLDKLSEETGAAFIWRAIYSPELIVRAGSDPFAADTRRGQYQSEYRTLDAKRWAALYSVPYNEPDWHRINWKHLALACVAADIQGAGEAFSRKLILSCFTASGPPQDHEALIRIAESVGITRSIFEDVEQDPCVEERHQLNVRDALAAGAFGVPTFVTEDGQLFFGQDRLPLLRQHLAQAIA